MLIHLLNDASRLIAEADWGLLRPLAAKPSTACHLTLLAGQRDGGQILLTTVCRTQLPKTPLKLEAGHILLPEGPGLGIELDPAALERYRIC
jgi:hypothetical protein